MKRNIKTDDLVRAAREAGKIIAKFTRPKHPRGPFDPVAYAAAPEVLG